jgi:hypothetical protein
MLGTTVPVAMAIRCPEFVHPWYTTFWDVQCGVPVSILTHSSEMVPKTAKQT